MNPIEEKIKKTSLTKTEKKIADYFLENMNNIGLETATDLASIIGVSDTSIIRFIRMLGFAGYSEFQKKMKGEIAQQINESSSPLQRLRQTQGKGKKKNIVEDMLAATMDNLSRTFAKLDVSAIDEVASVLVRSTHKYVVGFRGTSSVASFLVSKLCYFLPGVQEIVHADGTAIERIVDITEKDCMVIFTFPRYTELACVLAEIAKKKKTKIIVVTDKVTSPVSAYADIVMTASVQSLGFSNSYVAPMWIADLFILAVSEKMSEKNSRFLAIDRYINDNRLY